MARHVLVPPSGLVASATYTLTAALLFGIAVGLVVHAALAHMVLASEPEKTHAELG